MDLAFVDKFLKSSQDERKSAVCKVVTKSDGPPSTFEEFLGVEGLLDWPNQVSTEGPLNIQSQILLLGTQDDISALLRESAPLSLHILEDMEKRLDGLEANLNRYASEILTEDKRESRLADRLFHSPTRTFLTEVTESDAVKSHSSARGAKSSDFVESVMDTRKKSLDYCSFPGFRHGELVELPGQMEAPPILHRVTNAQDFNPGFKKFWKKLFLSEASVAIMQDSFWWVYLHMFNLEDGHQRHKDQLFDRIADSFVALFTTINTDVKDKFLSAYPDCLAQSVYITFLEAFPESAHLFNDSVKQELVNLVHEWITGLKPVPCTWKKWNVDRLESRSNKTQESETSAAAQQMMSAAALNKEVHLSLDMDSFMKVIDKMGDQTISSATPQGTSREKSSALTQSLRVSGTPQSKVYRIKCAKESHLIGPGPDYERVMFNTQGRSPLISHYLNMRQLRSYKQPGKKVRRTEIAKMPEEGQTYQELIQEKLCLSERLGKEYQRICDQTTHEINELEKKKTNMNRQIDYLQKELTFMRNPVDIKVLGERALDLLDPNRDTSPMFGSERTPSQSSSSTSSYDVTEDQEVKE
ncbi:protein FAM227B-like [Gigantopelta aegis]|uniref:protein FAM227B-like n=1 Tax=Gigantopelta aegis TaxID=1735272 RepID=UPI001B889F62|nr:protein FAM227B-like [Gigantopelta aegis]